MKRILLPFVSALVLACLPAFAQFPGMGGSVPGSDPVMTKFFGKNKAFTADAEFNIQDSKQKTSTMTVTTSMCDGKMRNEMDMTQMGAGKIPPAKLASLKQMGMDKMVMIIVPDKKMNYMVYPGLNAYVEMPINDASVTPDEKDYKIDKTSLGKETVDGHPCEKNKVVVTDAKGVTHECLVWNAADLKDFPVKLEMTENGSTITINYKNIKLEKPDAKLFEAPEGLTKYDGMPQMIQGEMMKRAGGARPGN